MTSFPSCPTADRPHRSDLLDTSTGARSAVVAGLGGSLVHPFSPAGDPVSHPENSVQTSPENRQKLARLLRRAMAAGGIPNKVVALDHGAPPGCVTRWASGEREVPIEVVIQTLQQARTPGIAAMVVEELVGISGRFDPDDIGSVGDARDEIDEAIHSLAVLQKLRREGADPASVAEAKERAELEHHQAMIAVSRSLSRR